MSDLVLDGAGNFRVKLALSLITLKNIVIKHIRHKDVHPGINDSEISLLNLINEISNGTVAKINDTGKFLLGRNFVFRNCC